MTAREKNMGLAVGAVAVICAGYWGFNKYRQYKLDLDKTFQKKVAERADTELQKKMAVKNAERWHGLGKQTLSMDPNQVQTRLRDDLNKLADSCELQNASVTIGKITTLGRPARDQKDFVKVLSTTVHAEGQIDGVARFLFRLHARPYIVRLKTLTLSHQTRTEKGRIVLHANLETPILPPTKLVARITPADKLDIPEKEEMPRTPVASFDDYKNTVVRRRLFEEFEHVIVKAINPTPAPANPLADTIKMTDLRWAVDSKLSRFVKSYKVFFSEGSPASLQLVSEPTTTQPASVHRDELKPGATYYWRVDTIHEDWEGKEVTTPGDVWIIKVKETPPPPPPRDDNNIVRPPPPRDPEDSTFTVASILSSPMGRYVVLEDRGGNPTAPNPNAPQKKVEIGQSLYDGTLVYLDPRGAVSAVLVDDKPQWRLHPLGQQVKDGMRPLTKEEGQYHDLYEELLKLNEKSTGITQRPETQSPTGG